jgi:hypothetical protein
LRDLADQSPDFYQQAITSLDGVLEIGAEAPDQGFGASKTNILIYDHGASRAWRPGFGVRFCPSSPSAENRGRADELPPTRLVRVCEEIAERASWSS